MRAARIGLVRARGAMLWWTERETWGMPMKDLAGKTAFVTGAASGIGFGIASALAQAGVKVMLCDIEEAALAAALEKLRLTNADVEGVRADGTRTLGRDLLKREQELRRRVEKLEDRDRDRGP